MLGDARSPARDARLRALIAFVAFAVGILVARELPGVRSAAWAGAGALAAAIALVLATPNRRRLLPWLFAASMLGAGGASWAWQVGERPASSVAGWLATRDAPGTLAPLIEIEGIVRAPPERATPTRSRLHDHLPPFMLAPERSRTEVLVDRLLTDAGPRRATGLAVVAAAGPPPSVRAGERIRVLGRARPVTGPTNPGEINFRPAARDRGDRFWLTAEDASAIERLPHPSLASTLRGAALAALAAPRAGARGVIDRAVPPDTDAGRLVRGLLLGQRDDEGAGLAGAFQRIGLAHLLSVSGFHVSVMALVALLAVRLTGDRGWIEPALVAAALLLYMLVVPARAPIVRAGLMALVLLISEASGRRHDRIAVLAWVAVAVLVLRPTDLFSIGFQLSFGLVGWLIILAEPRPDRLALTEVRDRATEPLWRVPLTALRTTAIATAACWTLALPTVWYHTGAVAPLAVLATVVTVPLIVVTMWLGFGLLLIAAAAPPLEGVLAAALGHTAAAAAGVVRWVDALPFATLWMPRVSLAWTVFATAAIAYAWRRGRWRSLPMWVLLAATVAWLGIEIRTADRLPEGVALRITMLDVGNGTAVLLERGHDALLWDAGSMREAVGVRTIDEACRATGAHRVPTLVITHANIDHYLGVLDIAGPLGVRRVVTGESFERQAHGDPDGPAAFVLAELDRLGIEHRVVAAGDTITLGDASLSILHPDAGFEPRSENDASLVARLRTADRTLLLTGDIQDEAIATLLTGAPELSADILELPHHGSARDAAFAFVDRVAPAVVLQSTGPQRLDDPRWAPYRSGRLWLTTARDGAVRVDIRDDGAISVAPAR